MSIWAVATIVFLFNLPFGYWRASVRKFSVPWVLSIHLPVPLVIALRIYSGLGWRFVTFPVLIGAFFFGQFVGARVFEWRKRQDRKSDNHGEHPPPREESE